MERFESMFLYGADWTWQRTGEALLTIRFYWWCGQYVLVVILPAVRRQYGWAYVCGCVVYAINWRYVYIERHGWSIEEPISAVALIFMLRDEERQVEWVSRQPTHIQRDRITPLNDRDNDYWSTRDRTIAGVLCATEAAPIRSPDGDKDDQWDDVVIVPDNIAGLMPGEEVHDAWIHNAQSPLLR